MKHISSGTVSFLFFALIIGLVTAYFVRHGMQEKETVIKPQMDKVVVSRVNLPKNSTIRFEDLQMIEVPPEVAPSKKDRINSRNIATGRIVKESIPAGTPLFKKQLFGIDEFPNLASQLPAGHRAVTINVEGRNAGNLIRANSYVDISLTVDGAAHIELGLPQKMITKTILKNVLVLTTGSWKALSERVGTKSTTLTVAVTPEQANRLILSNKFGTLAATLCSNQISNLKTAQGSNSTQPQDILGIQEMINPTQQTVIYRGGKAEVVIFDQSKIEEASHATIADKQRKNKAKHLKTAIPKKHVNVNTNQKTTYSIHTFLSN